MNKSFFLSCLVLLFVPQISFSQTAIHFYSYGDALIEKYSTEMAMKGGKDPWVQERIKELRGDLTREKIIPPLEGGAEDQGLPFAVGTKHLLPKPQEKLFAFVASPKLGGTRLLGSTRVVAYSMDWREVADGIHFQVDPRPIRVESKKIPEYSDTVKEWALAYTNGGDPQAIWRDWESNQILFVSVRDGTASSLLPQPIPFPSASCGPLLEKIRQREKENVQKKMKALGKEKEIRKLEKEGFGLLEVSEKMSFRVSGEKYVVIQIDELMETTLEIYKISNGNFFLVYQNTRYSGPEA